MTQPALEFFRKRSLTLKVEGTEGMDSTPVGADGQWIMNGSSSTEYDTIETPTDKSYFGNDEFATANHRLKIEGDFYLYAPATPGQVSTGNADCERLLLVTGMAVTKDAMAKTTTYSLISTGLPSYTAYFYHAGVLGKALGARGELQNLAMEINKRFMAKVSLTGTYDDMSASAHPSITLPTKKPVVATHANSVLLASTLTYGATASTVDTPLTDLHLRAKSLSVNFGNQLGHKEYTEYVSNRISDRKGTFSLRIAKTDLTDDFDPWLLRKMGTTITLAWTLNESDAADALFSTLNVRGQIEAITATDIDGDYGWDITGRCIPSSAGNDEVSIVFGDNS